MPSNRISSLILSLLTCLCSTLRADTVILKSGEKVEGKILGETDAEVTMSVQVSATIKDERVMKRGDIEKIVKVLPDEEAWATLANIAPGGESLEADEYNRVIAAFQFFIGAFPGSTHTAVAKQRLDQFLTEQKRVDTGEMKMGGQWLSQEKVQEERIQLGGHILLNRMKRAAGAGQFTEAMAIFDQLEKGFRGSASYADAAELGQRVLPPLKVAVEQRQAQLKNRLADEKQRLATSKGTEHDQLDALIKRERTSTEATITASERAGMKWLPLQPATERSLASLATRVTAETTRLNGLPVEKMRESVKAAEETVAALSKGNLGAAEKALHEAQAAWPENELAKRLTVKLAAAKKGSTPTKAATPVPTPTPKAKPSSSSSALPPVTAIGEVEPETKPFYKGTLFYIGLAAVVVFGALAGKMVARSRANSGGASEE